MSTHPEEEKPSRPNRVEMPGMIWVADHVLHLALKQETDTIPKNYFRDCQGILLLNMVELGVLVSGAYGTGCLFAKDDNGKWSPPCAMGIKSVGVGSFGTAVQDLIIFIFDRKSMENLASTQGLQMENKKLRATLGPLGRYTTTQPQVKSKAIENYAAFAFTKGAFAGITGAFASVAPAKDANKRFYKTNRKSEVTTEGILFGSVRVPKSKAVNTLLSDVYDKFNMLSNGKKYDGTEKTSASLEQAPLISSRALEPQNRRSYNSGSFSNTTDKTTSTHQSIEKRPSVIKNAGSALTQKPRLSVTKEATSVKKATAVIESELEYDC